MGRAVWGLEFHVLFWVGSGWVTTLVGRIGSGQENWSHVQLRAGFVGVIVSWSNLNRVALRCVQSCLTSIRVLVVDMLFVRQKKYKLETEIDNRIQKYDIEMQTLQVDSRLTRWHEFSSPRLCGLFAAFSILCHNATTVNQEAQLSRRGRAVVRVVEYFAKSLKVTTSTNLLYRRASCLRTRCHVIQWSCHDLRRY